MALGFSNRLVQASLVVGSLMGVQGCDDQMDPVGVAEIGVSDTGAGEFDAGTRPDAVSTNVDEQLCAEREILPRLRAIYQERCAGIEDTGQWINEPVVAVCFQLRCEENGRVVDNAIMAGNTCKHIEAKIKAVVQAVEGDCVDPTVRLAIDDDVDGFAVGDDCPEICQGAPNDICDDDNPDRSDRCI